MIPPLLGFLCILLFQTPAGTHLAYAVSSELAEHKPAVESYPKPSIDSANAASTLARTMAELEHSAAFRKAAKDAWRAARNGDAPFETGFAIDPDGRPGKLQSSVFAPDENAHHLKLVFSSTSLATFHVHNKFGDPEPSPHDIEIAKTKHKIMYVGSRDGLYSVDPDGNVRHVFTSPTWFE